MQQGQQKVGQNKEDGNVIAGTVLGRHWLVELRDCQPELLRQTAQVERIMRAAAETARAHIVSGHFHQFSPYGVSGVLVIQESHLTIHTWPEHGYAAVDIFTCSPDLRVREAIIHLQEEFRAKEVAIKMIERGHFAKG